MIKNHKKCRKNADKLNVNQITFFFHVLTNSYAAGRPGKFRSEVP